MKTLRLHILLGLVLLAFSFKAQNPGYEQLVAIIAEKMPNVDISDKIITFEVWSASDNESRTANKEFNRVCSIYKYAKLKNGNKGAIVISCNTDDKTTGDIAAKKDGINNLVTINKTEFSFLNGVSAGSNIVYDNTKNKVYENLSSDKIFTSYNQLIIR